MMEEQKAPRYAPGHELTLHPGDPVRGGGVLEREAEKRKEQRDRNRDGHDIAEDGPAPKHEPVEGASMAALNPAAGPEAAFRTRAIAQSREEAQDQTQVEAAAELDPAAGLRQADGSGGSTNRRPPGSLRQTRDGGVTFAATQEPEYRTVGPDGRAAAPQTAVGEEASLGATAQDDPMPSGLHTYPDQDRKGALTYVAVFEDITGAQACAEDLERRMPGVEVALVSRRGDGPEQGTRPGNVITGDGYGLSAEQQSPPADPGMGSGVAVGATVGATAGLLAATYFIPQFGTTLVGTGSLVSTLAGAGLGSFLGGLVELGASEQRDGDDATLYAGQARRGGVLLLARCRREEAEQVGRLLNVWQPLEVRIQ